MHERLDEFIHDDQRAADAVNDDPIRDQKRDHTDWLRYAFDAFRERNSLITTMTPDGRIVRIERIEA